MNKAAFFDRDGVINIDYGFVGKIENFDLINGIVEPLVELKRLGYKLVLVTNQSGIARGKYTEADFAKVTAYMQQSLAVRGAQFDAIYHCPHHPEAPLKEFRCECECRKPKPGMFYEAASDLNLSLEDSVMFGDHASDLKAARAAGIKELYLLGEHIETEKELIEDIVCEKELGNALNLFKMKKNHI